MKILLINHYAGSPLHGMEFRPYYLAKEWVKLGHEVQVVAADHSHLRRNNPKNLNSKFSLHESIEGVNYTWLKTIRYSSNGLMRLMNILSFVFQLFFFKKWLLIKPDLVIASSTYPLDIYPAQKIASKFNAKLVFELHDLWPLSPMEIGKMSKWHPFIVLMQMGENKVCKVAHKIVSILPATSSHFSSKGYDVQNWFHVPNGYSPDEWLDQCNVDPIIFNSIAESKAAGHFIFIYAGGHALSNALDDLLYAMEKLKNEPISLYLFGDGVEKTNLINLSNELGLNNVYFNPSVPKKMIPNLLGLADALYIGWKKEPLYRFGISPNKLIDYLLSGRPIVHAVDAANDLVSEANAGLSCKPEDPNAIASTIVSMANIPTDHRIKMGASGRDFASKNYNYKQLASAFLNSLDFGVSSNARK